MFCVSAIIHPIVSRITRTRVHYGNRFGLATIFIAIAACGGGGAAVGPGTKPQETFLIRGLAPPSPGHSQRPEPSRIIALDTRI